MATLVVTKSSVRLHVSHSSASNFESEDGRIRNLCKEQRLWRTHLVFLFYYFYLCKSEINYIKRGMGKELIIKYAYAKDFFKLKFLGKRHFLHFLWRVATGIRLFLIHYLEYQKVNFNLKFSFPWYLYLKKILWIKNNLNK